jgi:hypothetical protein
MYKHCKIIYNSTDVKDVKYIRFMLAEVQMFKMYTYSFSLIKDMMTGFVVT